MIIRHLGLVEFATCYAEMQKFTDAREDSTPDEVWLCEHQPTFTQGLAGKPEHLLAPTPIPLIHTNRGGQITYHGPGQVVAYPLVDLKRLGIFVKEYVYLLEECVLKTLLHFGVTGHRVKDAPGIYVRMDAPHGHSILNPQGNTLSGPDVGSEQFKGLGKIAALGIKVSRHRTYHGLSLNVAMDLSPFDLINPCGYPNLRTVDLSTIEVKAELSEVALVLGEKLSTYLQPRPGD
jgi:lipoyl(octanoyl) transferase